MSRFDKKWMLAPLAAALIAPAAASADITPNRDAFTLAKAISADPTVVDQASTEFTAIAPDDLDRTDDVPAALSNSLLTGFPLAGGDYAVLASGDASHADDPNDDDGFGVGLGYTVDNRGPETFDPVTLKIGVNVPSNANCLAVRFRFLSDEYPEFVNSSFNDAFIAELDTSDWVTTDNNNAIVAPNNFAYDQAGNPVTVNDAGAATFSPDNSVGTTYDGATRRLAAVKQVTPGLHQLYLSIFDRGDSALDSAVFLDNLQLLDVPAQKCSGAAFFDDAPPNVTSGGVALPPGEQEIVNGGFYKDNTPSFAGKGGITINDDPTITGSIFPGQFKRATPVNATPVQSKTVTLAADGSWVITADALPDGKYTFQAKQGSKNGETVSDPINFTVDNGKPATTIADTGFYSGKTRDLTPLLTGVVGTAPGDNPAVGVTVYAGKAATGTPVANVAGVVANGAWSAQLAAVKAGTYTATATQVDQAGNAATATKTFTVTTANPIGKVKLKKKLSAAKAAKGLKGSLKFAFPGKVTYSLSAKIGKKTVKVGSSSKTLAAPAKAAFNLKPKKAAARKIRAGAGALVLKVSFKDDQGRKYKRTQRVKFK